MVIYQQVRIHKPARSELEKAEAKPRSERALTGLSGPANAAVRLALILLAVGTCVPAAAQNRMDFRAGESARKALYELARCIAEKHPALAHQAVQDIVRTASEPSGPERSPLTDGRCLPDGASRYLRAPADLYWPALAEALIAGRGMLDDGGNYDDVPQLDHPAFPVSAPDDEAGSSAQSGEQVESQLRFALMSRIGECTVRRDAAGSRRLLETELASDGERAAAQALATVIGSCVSGGEVGLEVPVIRAMVALNYFRLAAAQSARQEAGDIQ